MGLIISRAEASCLPKKTQTLVELKRKMGCKHMSTSLPSTEAAIPPSWAPHLRGGRNPAPRDPWVPIPSSTSCK